MISLILIAIKMMMKTCSRKRRVLMKPKPRSNRDSKMSSRRKPKRKRIQTLKISSLKRRRLKRRVTTTMMIQKTPKSDRKRTKIKKLTFKQTKTSLKKFMARPGRTLSTDSCKIMFLTKVGNKIKRKRKGMTTTWNTKT